MERTSTISIKLARGGLALLFVWNVIRALTQSVTPGEAWNYERYIAPTWTQALANFDGNNHVLNTLLVRISSTRLHLTEMTLRAPSLLFGILYILAAYRIARRWFGAGPLFLGVLALLTLNPLVVDGMSEARGYGMALACWMWALDLVSSVPVGMPLAQGRSCAAGFLLGLSVVASLAFAAPAVALVIAAWRERASAGPPLPYGRGSDQGVWQKRSHDRKGAVFYLPQVAGLTAFVLLIIPINHAEASVVTQGATSMRQMLNQLTIGSFGFENSLVLAAGRIAIGLAAAMGLWFGFRRRPSELVCVTGGSLAVVLVLLLAAHRWAHAAFPEAGALYLVPVVTLFGAGLAAKAGRGRLQIALVVASALCAAHYVAHFRAPYRAAADFAGARDLARALEADAQDRGIRIAAPGDAGAILRYYKVRLRQGNWHTIEAPKPNATYDYYVMPAKEGGALDGRRVVYRDAGLILAK
jgi:hypothetical protein